LEINVALTPIKFGGVEGCKWMNDRDRAFAKKICVLSPIRGLPHISKLVYFKFQRFRIQRKLSG